MTRKKSYQHPKPLPHQVVEVLEVLSRTPDGVKLVRVSNRFGIELHLQTICKDFNNRNNKIFHYEICEGVGTKVYHGFLWNTDVSPAEHSVYFSARVYNCACTSCVASNA